MMWSKVKALLRKNRPRTPQALFEAIGDALSRSRPQKLPIILPRSATV
jgi:hypothetical protein